MLGKAESNPVGRRPVLQPRGRGVVALAWLSLLGPALGGCAMSFPMSSMLPDDVTGSLAKVPFGALLDAEDRRRETAALSTSLDPQGDGATVHWENPKSGRKGALTAVGNAYPQDNKVCRRFLGDMHDASATWTIEGTACIVHAGEWEVKDVKPIKRA